MPDLIASLVIYYRLPEILHLSSIYFRFMQINFRKMCSNNLLQILLLCILIQFSEVTAYFASNSILERFKYVSIQKNSLSPSRINSNWFSWEGNKKQTQGKPFPKKVVITEDAKSAYQFWLDLNGDMKESARNFLTLEACAKKFENLVETLGDSKTAVQIVSVDPTILSYSEERIRESFSAWVNKIGSREEAINLVIRNPPVLSIGQLFIQAASKGDILQTYFWSYVAVALRPVTLGLQKIISKLIFPTR